MKRLCWIFTKNLDCVNLINIDPPLQDYLGLSLSQGLD